MWPCRLGGRRKATIWGHLIALSVFLHGIALFALFVVYRGYYGGYDSYIVKLNTKFDVPVVFLPLCKRVGGQLRTSQSSTRLSSGATGHAKQPKKVSLITQVQPKVTKIQQSAHKKKLENKKKSKKTQKPVIKKIEKKSHKIKKIEPIKEVKPAVEKKQPKAERPKEPVVSKSELEKIPLSEISQQVAADHDLVVEKQPQIVAHNEVTAIEEPLEPMYIGQAERDFLQMHEQIQRILEEYWRPPAGLHREVTCHVRVMVDWQGKACSIIIEKSSSIPIYDISARAALAAMDFPLSARGKEIVIHFST